MDMTKFFIATPKKNLSALFCILNDESLNSKIKISENYRITDKRMLEQVHSFNYLGTVVAAHGKRA